MQSHHPQRHHSIHSLIRGQDGRALFIMATNQLEEEISPCFIYVHKLFTKMVKTPKTSTSNKLLLKVKEGVFHLALGPGFTYFTGNRFESIISTKLEKLWVPLRMTWPWIKGKASDIILQDFFTFSELRVQYRGFRLQTN